MKNGKKKMRLSNLETEEELLRLESNYQQKSLKERLIRIKKRKAKNKLCKLRFWLKDHIN